MIKLIQVHLLRGIRYTKFKALLPKLSGSVAAFPQVVTTSNSCNFYTNKNFEKRSIVKVVRTRVFSHSSVVTEK
jgi:hypothetical protein